ncbi:aquaporin-11 [Cylas formicarius]|uniref:aquaporin-11 n=1 Tax=Cylas formicarius TaxID=197179 RepID=UPI0029585B53|nr:aquaporin-11 [Cylas formicarius]
MAKPGIARTLKRLANRLGVLGYSKRKNVQGLNPLIISSVLIGLTLLIASLSRKLTKSFIADGTVRLLVFEFIATLELCASCFELIVVADNWGVGAYAVFLFLLTIWWSRSWEDASACPYVPLEEVVEGAKSAKTALMTVGAQLVAALVTFRYVQLLWSFEMAETHLGKAYEQCTADLQVDAAVGAAIECILTCACRLTSRVVGETHARFGNFLDAFFATAMVVLAFNFSGGYFNPALATSLKLGCAGNTFVEHLLVYWVGACVGSLLSVLLFRSSAVQGYVDRAKSKTQ